MSSAPGPAMLVHRTVDDDDEEQFKPLAWGLIRRLFTYTGPARARCAGSWS
jgi:hypothetical protein